MKLPNRKCPLRLGLVLVLLTGCQYYTCEALGKDACIRSGVINLQQHSGHIEGNGTVLGKDCQLWSIQGQLNDTILIRISVAHFDESLCVTGSNLILGPLPYLDICALNSVHLPVVYRSKRDHVWIKYLVGTQPWNPRTGSQFSLDYVTSSSSSCSFRCIFDGTCIPKDWQCNGQEECSQGEDEYMCNRGNDEPPHAVTSPDVIIQYPQTWFTLYGDRSTDDHGIVKYMWTRISTDALSCDMSGTRTSQLHLSNLEVGEYTFRLTVSDKLGQISRADVRVKVKPAASYDTLNITSTRIVTKVPTTSKGCFHCYVVLYKDYSCLPNDLLCDGTAHCRNGEDEDLYACENKERMKTTKKPVSVTCGYHEIYCYVTTYRRPMCLHNMYTCDGNTDCAGGEDEKPTMCGDRACNKRLEESVGWFASPNFPDLYPQHTRCSWVIHKQGSSPSSTIQLRKVFFSLEEAPDTDFMNVYDGADSTYKLIGTYYGSHVPPVVIESSSNWMNIVFSSDYFNRYRGFNFTYQIKGECLPSQTPCMGENDCYDTKHDRCNGLWNCPLKGSDEIGCGNCKEDYSCGKQTLQCYHSTERCNGLARCSNSFDELHCTMEQCGTHNGTFLCDNRRCIYESWTCDERDDCGDNSDEQFCTGTTKRVVIAAICGSMICALLLVILLGCSCKLYSLRTMDHHHRYPRHETPMSRMYAEFLRRRAPPPYHEAMLTSRNFDEVQQEYIERMRNSRRSQRGSRGNRRRSRNQQNQSQADNGGTVENQSNTNGNNDSSLHEGTSGVQLSTINEENENNVSTGRTSSTAELLPSESETDSDDIESETDLAEQGEGQIEGHRGSNNANHITEGDDDDENILASTSLSAQWMRNVDSDESSDDACILDLPENMRSVEELSSRGQGHCDNASVDTEATASIASIEQQEIPNNVRSYKDSENESDSDEDVLENSRNSTPKPDSNHSNAVISETSGDYVTRAGSHGSLNSIGSETHSENDVPLLPMNSVVTQHF